MFEESICEVCKQPATQKCGGCRTVFYCSKDHQKQGWKKHKFSCKPFKICEDEKLGRHLVATRDIKPGDIILKEPPLIWGPSQITVPVCLGCGKTVTAENNIPCSKCGWPVCSEKCEQSCGHLPECYYTVQAGKKVQIKNFGVPHPNYQCLTVLRCLYQKQFAPEKWNKMELLQSHCEERKKTEKLQSDRLIIVKLIHNFFNLGTIFTEEEILKVCGMIIVNGHEVPLTDPSHVAIYESTSMFEHSCRANCSKSFTSSGGVLISAAGHIKKDEHLSICYTDSLWGTPNRRHHLYETKFFWCECVRCADPSEFGTFFSSIRCQNKDCKGYLLPDTFVSDSNNDPPWRCNKCEWVQKENAVHGLLDDLGRNLESMEKGSSKACKNFIAQSEEKLHPNHYYVTDVKVALAQLIGQEFEGGLPAVSDDDIELKAKLCKKLTQLIETLAPAEKRLRGILLFELHAAITEMGRRTATSGEGPDVLNSALIESKGLLYEATELLKHEPSELPEGKIYQQALSNLKEIDIILRAVHQTIGKAPI